MRHIYLDYNASTPVDPRVWRAMCAAGEGAYGNPSSAHWAGAPAKQALERGRQQVASILGCSAEEVVLTSGGSEANNLALKGVFFANQSRGAHIITTQVEHPSILAPCEFLEARPALPDPTKPAENCPHCRGRGIMHVEITPTDELSTAGRALYKSASQDKDGVIKVEMQSKADAAEMLNKLQSAYVTRSLNLNANVAIHAARDADPAAALKLFEAFGS